MHRRIVSSSAAVVVILAGSMSAADTPASSMRLDGDVSRDVGGGCHYTAAIHGTMKQVKSGDEKAKTAKAVDPNIEVKATLTCPTVETVKITDNVTAGPLTEEQLVRALERRATLVAPRAKGRCVYVPELAIAGGRVTLQSVSSDCR